MSQTKLTRRSHVDLLLWRTFRGRKVRWPKRSKVVVSPDYFRFRTIEQKGAHIS